jgi:hypothetical protein
MPLVARAPLAVATLVALLGARPALADAKGAQEAEMQKMMAAFQKAGTPGPEHAKLKAMAGSYDVAVKAWLDPAVPPEESKGHAELKSIFGDRYLQQEFTGSMMGQEFSGMGIVGYNNVSKKYFSLWLDSTTTALYSGEGTADSAGALRFATAAWDPLSGKQRKGKDVFRAEPDGSLTFESWGTGPHGGKEFKMLEIRYTRKK